MVDAQISSRALTTLLGEWRASANAGGTAYGALADRIRLLIIDGRIPVDTRLPAERELAEQLELSRTTVTAAYRQLRELGFVQSVRGSGSVTRLAGSPTMLSVPGDASYLDLSKAAMPALPWLVDASRRGVEELPKHLGGSGFDPIGTPGLRAAIADRYTARGLPTMPEQIMVTIGAQHAIALLSRALLGRGDRALIGELIMLYAIQRGFHGFVVDGAVRDSAAFLDAGFPCYAKTLNHKGPYKLGPGQINVAVNVCGQVVNPGDWVVGDEDGVVTFAPESANELIAKALATAEKERGIKQEISNGHVYQKWLFDTLEKNQLV